MKNVRVKVRQGCGTLWYDFGIYEGKKELLTIPERKYWRTEKGVVRNAKAMAKRIGIPYDSEIIKQKGC